MCSGKCNFSSKLSVLTMDEKTELEELRSKVRVYESLCIGDKITEAWMYGYQAHQFAKDDNSIETRNKLFLEDKENIIFDELQILLGESTLEDDRRYC